MSDRPRGSSRLERAYDDVERRWTRIVDRGLERFAGTPLHGSVVGRLEAFPSVLLIAVGFPLWGLVCIKLTQALPDSVEPGLATAFFSVLWLVGGLFWMTAFMVRRAWRDEDARLAKRTEPSEPST